MKNHPPEPLDNKENHPVPTAPTEVEVNKESFSQATIAATTGRREQSMMDEDDEEAMLEAARHRHHASSLVRDHLEQHVAHNPGASSDFVTWIATLHPENADITIDQRFFVSGNPWWTIYEETKNSSHNHQNHPPIATAVPVTGNEEESEFQRPLFLDDQRVKGGSRTQNHPPHFCQTCNPFALVLGLTISIPIVVMVLVCELMALFFCHLPATMFYHGGQVFIPPNLCCLLYAILMILYGIFSLVDSLLLVISVVITEIVGCFAWVVGFLTGGCLWANHLHQFLRKFCHGIRIQFRKSNHYPARGLCWNESPKVEEDERESNRVKL